MNKNQQIREMLLLNHICAIATTIVINKKILEWLKNHNIIFVWELYTDIFTIEQLEQKFNQTEISEFKKLIESLFGSLDSKLSREEIRDLYIKSHTESFRFDLDVMCLSFTDVQGKINKKLLNILTNNASFTHLWMLYENRHTDTTGKPFKETFLSWRGTSKTSLHKLEQLLQQLELPELDSIKFTDKEIDILEAICK